MPAAAADAFSLRRVQAMLSLSPKAISRLVAAGFVTPSRGPRNALQFSFQDVVVLRTAHQLREARVPPGKILSALGSLRASLPPEMPLTGLRIAAIGGKVAVVQGGQPWEAESGQLLFAFDLAPSGTAIAFEAPAPAPELEPVDVAAQINLGASLCDAGRCDEAVQLLAEALEHAPDEPLLHFNLAIALEDQSRLEEALAHYDRCLALDPGLADAHFNMARLHDKLGQPHQALRHYSAYRRGTKA